jgi:hypothetical protein
MGCFVIGLCHFFVTKNGSAKHKLVLGSLFVNTAFAQTRGGNPMLAIKKARKYIEAHPDEADAIVLSSLVLALESDAPMTFSSLYSLDYDRFKLSLEIIEEWRLDRYYSSKIRLLEASMEVGRLSTRTPDAVKPTMVQPQ